MMLIAIMIVVMRDGVNIEKDDDDSDDNGDNNYDDDDDNGDNNYDLYDDADDAIVAMTQKCDGDGDEDADEDMLVLAATRASTNKICTRSLSFLITSMIATSTRVSCRAQSS